MRVRALIPVLLATVGINGCSKSSSTSSSGVPAEAKRSGDAADALWDLAPDKVVGAIVVTPAAIGVIDTLIDHGRSFANDPELALLSGPLGEIGQVLGGPQAHLADAGFAADKGFAFFQTEDGALIGILPMGDREKLLKTMKGTHAPAPADFDIVNSLMCKPVKTFYACTKAPETFDRIGKGKDEVHGKTAAAGARGDVEVFLSKSLLGSSGFDHMVATAILENGQVSVRAFAAGTPSGALATLVSADKPAPSLDKAAGFVIANIAPMLQAVPDFGLPGDTSTGKLAKTIKGPVIATMPAGLTEYSVRIPLSDPAPFTALLGKCAELGSMIPLASQQPAGACRIAPKGPIPIEIDVWVEGSELRLASHKGGATKGTVDAMTPIGTELSTGGWSYAMWGRGSMITPNGMTIPTLPGPLPPTAMLALRAFAQINEVGLGVKIEQDGIRVRGVVRTIWANPPEVAKKLAAISADSLVKNTAGATMKSIVDGAPNTPIASDIAAGQTGMMAPVMAIGVLSAVAIPAFMDYMKKSKQSEATVQLRRLGTSAKVAYLEKSQFPVGEVAVSPTSCCAGPKGKCPVDAAAAANPIWQALDFQLDEPTRFRYGYTSNGTTFTATAVGDLDCDMTEVTYTLTGKVDSGNVVLDLQEPSPGSD